MGIGVLCSIVTGLAIPANIFIFGDLVGSMVEAEIRNPNINPEMLNIFSGNDTTTNIVMEAVTKFALGNTIIGIILLIFTYFSIMLFNYTALKQTYRIRIRYLKSVLHQDIAWYDLSKSGEVASRLTE